MHPTLARWSRSNLRFALLLSVALSPLAAPMPSSGQAADPNGVWTSLGPSDLPGFQWGSVIVDPLRDRLLAFGGTMSSNAVWSMSLTTPSPWIPYEPPGGTPPHRMGQAAIYDPVRDRMIVYGGRKDAIVNYNDTWALPLDGESPWQLLVPTELGPTTGSFPNSGVYDPVRDRMIVSCNGALWSLSLSGAPQWAPILPAGGPVGTAEHMMYDPNQDRLVVVESGSNVGYSLNLSGSPTWTTFSLPNPTPGDRFYYSTIFDPARQLVDLYGGWGGTQGQYLSDIWQLSLGEAPLWTSASMSPVPAARDYHSSVYDAARDRMLVVGGFNPSYYPLFNDVWALPLDGSAGWSKVRSIPGAGRDACAIYDPVGDRLVGFGGNDGADRNETWEIPGAGPAAAARSLATTGSSPPARSGAGSAYDPVRHRMLVFGGVSTNVQLNDVWALSLDDPPTWTQLFPAGTPPSTRASHTMVYDPTGDRLIVFGGVHSPARLNDTWALSLSGSPEWTQLVPAGTPPGARYGHRAVYDPARSRMLVFGGFAGSLKNDVWALSLSGSQAWQQLATTTPAGTSLAPRQETSLVYDPVRDRMVVFGGLSPSLLNDTWALQFSGPNLWTQLAPSGTIPQGRSGHDAVYDALRDRMLAYGGAGQFGGLSEIWELSWRAGPTTSVGAPRAPGFSLAGVLPNPATRAQFSVSFSLPDNAPARLDLLDLAGRRIWSRDVGALGAGSHVVAVPSVRRPPGVYMVRLTRDRQTLTAKAALIE